MVVICWVFFQDTLDAVENLIKKHEAFEKAAATQEERFAALEKPTTVSGMLVFFVCALWCVGGALCDVIGTEDSRKLR